MKNLENKINSENFNRIHEMENTFQIIDLMNEGWMNTDISNKFNVSIGDLQVIELWAEENGLY